MQKSTIVAIAILPISIGAFLMSRSIEERMIKDQRIESAKRVVECEAMREAVVYPFTIFYDVPAEQRDVMIAGLIKRGEEGKHPDIPPHAARVARELWNHRAAWASLKPTKEINSFGRERENFDQIERAIWAVGSQVCLNMKRD